MFDKLLSFSAGLTCALASPKLIAWLAETVSEFFAFLSKKKESKQVLLWFKGSKNASGLLPDSQAQPVYHEPKMKSLETKQKNSETRVRN